jgi:uncharacterized protein (TIGR02145 family)
MQEFTTADCQALPIYDKSNPTSANSLASTVTLKDTRNDQEYTIRRLQDGKCWMVDNLKLGSDVGPMLLNDTNTDLNNKASFELPQITTSGSVSYDIPGAYGPISGDTGTGITNYGYLYNWSAATAGESRTTMPLGSGNAPNSICPANWRLPTGDSTGEFAILNGSMYNNTLGAADVSTDSVHAANWQNAGSFKGVFSGYWIGSFGNQTSGGYFWSSSASTTGNGGTYNLLMRQSDVNPGASGNRSSGLAIRCVAGP